MTLSIPILAMMAATLCFSCTDTADKPQEALSEKAAALLQLKSKFKHTDLRQFEIDSLGFDKRQDHYQEVDTAAYKLIFQEGKEERNDHDYYYSWQNRDSGQIAFVLLSENANGYCSVLRHYVYDRQGKLVSKFELAANCGDAGWWFEQAGRQLDQDHFTTWSVETQSDLNPENEKETGDSIVYAISVLPGGAIDKKESFRKHFVRAVQEYQPPAATTDSTTITKTSQDSIIHE